ncbi:MAG: hypothetical protein KY451_07970 [Actinobacteria bacterium]|nr:hypothetical protein [Actinomycetota bacterium]MBW3647787.1 hypothetical protein [Actinomycetota bacterium]
MNPDNPAGQARPTGGGAMSERMQALLSRAAEEQLNEQRQVSVVLGDLRQLLTGLSDRVDALARRIDDQVDEGPSAVPESLSALQREVSGLDDRLEVAAQRPVLTEQTLQSGLAPVFTRLDALDERLSGLTDTAERLPAVATTLTEVSDRVDALSGVRDEVAGLRAGVAALQEDQGVPTLVSGVAAMRELVEELGGRVAKIDVPTRDSVAAAVSSQVTDRLVDELAPRVADQVVHKVASTLVDQVAGSVSASVQSGLAEQVRTISAESERRISAHVDDAVLALAEALLRRRRTGRALAPPAPDPVESGSTDDAPEPPAEPEAAADAESRVEQAPEPAGAKAPDEPGDAGAPAPEDAAAAAPGPATEDAPKEDLGEFATDFERSSASPDEAGQRRDRAGESVRKSETDLPEVLPADVDRPPEPGADENTGSGPQAGAVVVEDLAAPTPPRRQPPPRAGHLRTAPPSVSPTVSEPVAARTTRTGRAVEERQGPFEWEPEPPSTTASAPPPAVTQADSAKPLGADEDAPDDWYDSEGDDGPRRRPWWRPGG